MLKERLKKYKTADKRPRYLRYDDVFMSKNQPTPKKDVSKKYTQPYGNPQSKESVQSMNTRNKNMFNFADEEDNEFEELEDDVETIDNVNDVFYRNPAEEQKHFVKNPNILNEKIIQYKKRQLPTLQRYESNNPKNLYTNAKTSAYWLDQDEYRKSNNRNNSIVQLVWQKFVVTFASILSLVFLTWFIYNLFHKNDEIKVPNLINNTPDIIEPEQSSFKVLPEYPGGIDIPHQDKSVYEKINPNIQHRQKENLLPPEEEPVALEPIAQEQAAFQSSRQTQIEAKDEVEEYSIVDEKIYYVKLFAGKAKDILQNEIALLRKKFSGIISNDNCAIKKVSNTKGDQKYAILIGPFDSKTYATDLAKSLETECSIISVKEK